MGWWTIGEGLVVGDGPVEAVQEALERLAGEHGAPSLREVLDAATAVLRDGAGELVCDPEEARGASVRVGGGGPGSEPGRARAAVRDALHDAWDEARVEYLDSELARRPYVRELLAATTFALRARQGGLLGEWGGVEPSELELELG